jgi:hypothetical protein
MFQVLTSQELGLDIPMPAEPRPWLADSIALARSARWDRYGTRLGGPANKSGNFQLPLEKVRAASDRRRSWDLHLGP